MGEALPLFRFDFNGSIRVDARAERLTSDSGTLVLRELMEKLGIIEWIADKVKDPRDPDLITHPLAELLRTNLLLYAQGWRDHDDADALRHDGAFRLAVSDRHGTAPLKRRTPREDDRPLDKNPEVPDGLASQPTLSRLVGLLAKKDHREILRSSLLEVAARRIRGMRGGHRPRYLTLDIDSLPIDVHGSQPGSKHNGHYHSRIYHPLIASIAETGDLIDARLREGNVHTAEGGVDFIDSLLSEVEKKLFVRLSRGESVQTFNIWVYGDEYLARGSGLYVGMEGTTCNHHFLLPSDGTRFEFLPGEYSLEVYASLVGSHAPSLMARLQLTLSDKQAAALKANDTGIYFDWGPDSGKYYAHTRKKPMRTIDAFLTKS